SALAPLLTCLVLAGAAGASVHAASGRLILGWFPLDRRGFAMGVRQTALPLGTALAALTLPVLGAYGAEYAFAAITYGCLVAAGVFAAVVRDPGGLDAPTRPQHTPPAPGDGPTSPYRGSQLWRLHASSAALAVPQITLAAFGLTFLVDERGWTASGGGRLLALAQVGGAGARLLAGWWSDRTGSRTVPLRRAAAAGAVTVAGFAAAAASGSTAVPAVLVPALLVTATIVTLSPNGLAFTAVAERAGLAWAGRALGVQNSGQNAVAALTPPLMAGLAAGPGYPAAFAVAATFSVLAVLLVPERPRSARADRSGAPGREDRPRRGTRREPG
ncbi:MAG: MFS transporter, partial [Kineosporiaceae bacterium]